MCLGDKKMADSAHTPPFFLPFISALILRTQPGPHKIQGIGAGFIPGVLNTSAFDEVIKVREGEGAS